MKNILHVESWPSSPDVVDEYNRWYNDVHIPEVLALDGFVSARRYAPIDDDGPYITEFELEGDPQAAIPAVVAAFGSGKLNMSPALRTEPRPKMRILRQV